MPSRQRALFSVMYFVYFSESSKVAGGCGRFDHCSLFACSHPSLSHPSHFFFLSLLQKTSKRKIEVVDLEESNDVTDSTRPKKKKKGKDCLSLEAGCSRVTLQGHTRGPQWFMKALYHTDT